MNTLLILRCELVCAIFLMVMFVYNLAYSRKKQKSFLVICIIALSHVIFDGITVYTVNNIGTIDPLFNVIFHLAMYLFAVLFSCSVLCYTIDYITQGKNSSKITLICKLTVAVYLVVLPFLKIEYVNGNGTMYSVGSAAVFSYMVAFTYIILSLILFIVNVKKTDRRLRLCLFPTMLFMILITVVQIAVPELLFTGGAITVVTAGLFFSIENPIEDYRKQAFIDIDTGIKNKKCYENELVLINEKYFGNGTAEENVAVIVCDINGVKAVNESYGHIKGDELIQTAAKILSKVFHNAYGLYRIGGDEFIAVFTGENALNLNEKIETVREVCKGAEELACPLSIAMGIAEREKGEEGDITELIGLADLDMYTDKRKNKSVAIAQ